MHFWFTHYYRSRSCRLIVIRSGVIWLLFYLFLRYFLGRWYCRFSCTSWWTWLLWKSLALHVLQYNFLQFLLALLNLILLRIKQWLYSRLSRKDLTRVAFHRRFSNLFLLLWGFYRNIWKWSLLTELIGIKGGMANNASIHLFHLWVSELCDINNNSILKLIFFVLNVYAGWMTNYLLFLLRSRRFCLPLVFVNNMNRDCWCFLFVIRSYRVRTWSFEVWRVL